MLQALDQLGPGWHTTRAIVERTGREWKSASGGTWQQYLIPAMRTGRVIRRHNAKTNAVHWALP